MTKIDSNLFGRYQTSPSGNQYSALELISADVTRVEVVRLPNGVLHHVYRTRKKQRSTRVIRTDRI